VQIVIVGAGTVGYELAIQLQRQGHDVALIERKRERAQEIADKLDILVVPGSGSSMSALEAAGIKDAKMILAVTSVDEINILSCGLAARYGVPERIARVRNHELTNAEGKMVLDGFGVTRFINPEKIIVQVIDQIARVPDAIEVFGYHEGEILISRHIMKSGMPVVGRNLKEILKMAGGRDFLAVALRRHGETRIPAGDDVLMEGDDVTTIFSRRGLPKYLELLNLESRIVHRAVVAGRSLTAVQLCDSLSEWVENVVYLDPDYEHGVEAAERLEGVEVLHGDPTERDFLQEAGVANTDLFVGAGEETSKNVMSALLARSEGAKNITAISMEPRSNRLFREIGVDHVISPRRLMAREIMDIIHRGRISVELQLRDMDLESLEIKAEEGSKITRGSLAELFQPLRGKAIAGAIFREGEALIPRGDTHVMAGDEVVIVTQPKTVPKVHKLFKGGRS
jgi:trk system potassium uptake protein